MEQMLDLPVQSVPLKHLTKHRIRNNSRKILLPSKGHLKRNLIGEQIYFQYNHQVATETRRNMGTLSSNDNVKLKLPPPPIAKKPKVSLPSTTVRKASSQNEVELNGSRQKPAVAPKPAIVQSATSRNSEMNNNVRNLTLDLKANNKKDDEPSNETPIKDLTSPTKSFMSFSERLKASSLSRRKEGNSFDGSQGRFRSQIISPIRRGSRSFLNSDASLDNDTKPKSRESIFRRYSSETSFKSVEAIEDIDGNSNEGFDLEQFKNLSLETVDPVAVDSVLETNNSFEEDDIIKDSFDSGELFQFGSVASKLKEDRGETLELIPPKDTSINELDSSKKLSSSVIMKTEQDGLISADNTALAQSLYFENDEKLKPFSSSDVINRQINGDKKYLLNSTSAEGTPEIEKLADFEIKAMKSSNMNQTSSIDVANASQTVKNNTEYEGMKISPTLRSPRKFGKGKEGSNARRKFRPVGMDETVTHSSSTSRVDFEIKDAKEQESSDTYLIGQIDTDSSLEHVTQDIELDSTFEIPLLLNDQLSSNTNKFNEKNDLNDEEGWVFVPDLSSSSPLMAQEDQSDGMKLNFLPLDTAIRDVQNTDYKSFQVTSEQPDYVMQDANEPFIKADEDFSLETVPNFDVEMLPFVPPPPMDEGAYDNDEDMTLNIIEPPTIYGDCDMDFIGSIDLPSMESNMEKHREIVEGKEETMEEGDKEIKGDIENGFDETDFLQSSKVFTTQSKAMVLNNDSKKAPDDVVLIQQDANVENLHTSLPALDSKKIDEVPKSNVLSIAKKFDAFRDDKPKVKPAVPAKPTNLHKKFIKKENKDGGNQTSKLENLAVLNDKNKVVEKDTLNGYHSPGEISDIGKERRRSFSDRSIPVDEASQVKEESDDGKYKDYLEEAKSKENPILSSNDDSSLVVDSWINQLGYETNMEKEDKMAHPPSSITRFVDSSSAATTGHAENDFYSNFVTQNSSFNTQDEILPVYGQTNSRKSSAGSSTRDNNKDDGMELSGELLRKRWSSFSSTSSDEQVDEKKVNIVKLMRERTLPQSDGNIGSDDDYIGKSITDVDDGLKFSHALDTKSDDETEQQGTDDLDEVLLQDDSKFESTPLDEWTVDDVGDWLEMIGLSDLRCTFEEKHIDGRQLQAIDLQLLDEIGITNVDDRELILSEIYALKNPEDFDIEMSLLDALDNVSGYDREKMLAVLEVLKMSSEDQENRYLPSSTPPKLSAGTKQKSPKSKKAKGNYRRAISEYTGSSGKDEFDEERSKSASPFKKPDDTWDLDTAGENNDAKKSSLKKRSFLKEAFSFHRKKPGRLSKLFSSRKKLVDSSLKYLLETTPQGVIKIWTNGIKESEMDNVPLLVTSTTTSLEVTKTVIEKLELAVDVNCYYLVQSHSTKSVPEIVLKEDDCPLVFQCRWPDAQRYKFELKKHCEGSVIVVFSDEGNDERSVKIETTMKTKCSEIIAIALKRLQKPELVNSFSLYQMKNRQGQLNIFEDSQIPMDAQLLKMTPFTLQPAVFKLVRVNFLGSPQKSLKPDENQRIRQLENEIREKQKQLVKANEFNSTLEAKLEEVTKNNEYLKQKFKDQNDDVARLENIADTLRMELDQKSDGLSRVIEEPNRNEKEMLVKKLSRQEMKNQSLEEWIENLEKTLQQKEDEVRRLRDCQVKIGNYKDKEITEKSTKLKEMEEETIRLKSRIVETENNALEAKVQFSERENQLSEDNMALKKEIEQLKRETLTRKIDEEKHGFVQEKNEHLLAKLSELERLVESRNQTIAMLRDTQIEKEKLDEEVNHLREELIRKQKVLDELENVITANEDLKNEIISLERSVKQKDKMISDASAAQKNIKDLRKELEVTSEEIAVKSREAEDARQKSVELQEKFKYDLKQKDLEMEEMRHDLAEIRKQNCEADEEKKRVKSRLRELEMELRKKNKQLEELNDVHEEYRGQSQKMKKLERELTIRSDEIQKLNLEKEESVEDLRSHAQSLEQRMIDKDSKILELEFRIEKTERNLREAEDLVDDGVRDKSRLSIAVEDGLDKVKELNKKVDDYKRLIGEKDKIIQTLKGSQNDFDENQRRELSNTKRVLIEKERMIEQMRATIDEERMEMKSRFETLQELVNAKEAKWKDKEARLIGERESEKSSCAQLEEKLNEKDATVRRLEAKVSKLEKVARDNMKKFEKFMSDKDRMLQKVKEESQKDITELKNRIRQMDESLREKEKHALQLNRSGSIRNEYEIKLRQKDEENKQHKFLLERLMSVANSRDPRILEEFENSFGQTPSPKDDERPLLSKSDNDWC